jgi:hypothetical protein
MQSSVLLRHLIGETYRFHFPDRRVSETRSQLLVLLSLLTYLLFDPEDRTIYSPETSNILETTQRCNAKDLLLRLLDHGTVWICIGIS